MGKEKRKWRARIYPKGQTQKFGGYFKDELDAAKRVNQLCEKLEIPPKNPGISAGPNQQSQKREKISESKGVYFNKERKIWYVLIKPKGQKLKNGGYFKNKLDAVKRVNQLRQEFGLPLQNAEISTIQNQQYQKKKKHHTIKEFPGTVENGMLLFTRKGKNRSMVECSKMNWMQQREQINFVKN